jgi:hypothetical protein
LFFKVSRRLRGPQQQRQRVASSGGGPNESLGLIGGDFQRDRARAPASAPGHAVHLRLAAERELAADRDHADVREDLLDLPIGGHTAAGLAEHLAHHRADPGLGILRVELGHVHGIDRPPVADNDVHAVAGHEDTAHEVRGPHVDGHCPHARGEVDVCDGFEVRVEQRHPGRQRARDTQAPQRGQLIGLHRRAGEPGRRDHADGVDAEIRLRVERMVGGQVVDDKEYGDLRLRLLLLRSARRGVDVRKRQNGRHHAGHDGDDQHEPVALHGVPPVRRHEARLAGHTTGGNRPRSRAGTLRQGPPVGAATT